MHVIEAIIAQEKTTKDIESRFVQAKSIPLSQGYSMIPLTDELKDDLDELVDNSKLKYECFKKLTKSVYEILQDSSSLGKVAYIETEIFGGSGSQAAIVWEYGKVIQGPDSSGITTNPINLALHRLGVRIVSMQDEFDELNLGWVLDDN